MKTNKSDIQEVMEQIVSFTQERDWDQFHNGKDLALALSIEASELNEAFLWKEAEKADINKIKEELADIMNYAFLIAHKYIIRKSKCSGISKRKVHFTKRNV